jgi:hypothetical protein
MTTTQRFNMHKCICMDNVKIVINTTLEYLLFGDNFLTFKGLKEKLRQLLN